MEYKSNFTILKIAFIVVCTMCLASVSLAQHRGDQLHFQGMDLINRNGVKSQAMGGAYTAVSGELEALFWNPAGLIGIEGIQFTANYSSSNHLWRERQDYRPNRQLVTMSFILDGLYQPNPDFNGWIDNEAFLEDSTYMVDDPVLGQDNYSEETADWEKELDDSGLNNMAIAFPFTLADRPVVVSAGYSSRIGIFNYDRNQTHLFPHIAFDGYDDIPDRVTAAEDSVRITWSDFERQRRGPLKNLSAAFAVGLTKQIDLGIGFNNLSGETDEFQQLNRVGYFDLVEGIQIFKFSYDTLDVIMEGQSDFSATSFDFGATIKLQKLSVGFKMTPAYTINREWNATTVTATADSSFSQITSGKDELDVPLSYSFGATISPRDNFKVAFNMEHKPYSEAEFNFEQADSTHRSWADQTSWGVGLEYRPFKNLSLLAGYRNIPQVFIPDGAADRDRGPEIEAYTLGASFNVEFIRFDLAYEIASMKYYDNYFSNTNYVYESLNSLRAGITLTY